MIEFACNSCGKRYSVAEQYGGRVTQCKACGETIQVPAGSSSANSDHAESAACPGCGKPLKPAAVLCVGCGYDTRMGAKINQQLESNLGHTSERVKPQLKNVLSETNRTPLLIGLAAVVALAAGIAIVSCTLLWRRGQSSSEIAGNSQATHQPQESKSVTARRLFDEAAGIGLPPVNKNDLNKEAMLANRRAQANAIEELRRFDVDDIRECRKVLLEHVDDPNSRLRGVATELLLRLAPDDDQVAAKVLALMKSTDSKYTRHNLSRVLGHFSYRPGLEYLLQQDEQVQTPNARGEILAMVAKSGDPKVIQLVVKHIEHPGIGQSSRSRMIVALGQAGEAGSEALSKLITEGNPDYRGPAYRAQANIGRASTAVLQQVELDYRSGPSPYWIASGDLLQSLNHNGAEVLASVTGDSTLLVKVRQDAIQRLSKMPDVPTEAYAHVLDALLEQSPTFRLTAIKFLGRRLIEDSNLSLPAKEQHLIAVLGECRNILTTTIRPIDPSRLSDGEEFQRDSSSHEILRWAIGKLTASSNSAASRNALRNCSIAAEKVLATLQDNQLAKVKSIRPLTTKQVFDRTGKRYPPISYTATSDNELLVFAGDDSRSRDYAMALQKQRAMLLSDIYEVKAIIREVDSSIMK